MRKRLLNNIGMKLISVLAAIIIWLIIVTVNDPYGTMKITLQVQELNAENLESLNKTYEVVSGSTATATIRARASVLANLNSDDFIATADLSRMSDTGAVWVDITAKEGVRNVEIIPDNNVYQVVTEDLVEKQFPVIVKTEGQVANGYYLGELRATPNIVNIRGSETSISNIKEVVVVIDVSGYSSNINSEGLTPVLYNFNDEEMDTSRITMDVSTVDVSISMLRTKTIPVNLKFTGAPAPGYMIISQDSPETAITIAGIKADLDEINELNMEYNIDGASENIEQTVLFREFLPENVYLADGDLETSGVPVNVVIEPVTSKNIEVDFSDVTLQGASEDLTYALYSDGSMVSIPVTGAKSVVDALTASDISVSANVLNYTTGIYSISLTVRLSGGVKNATAESGRTVTIQISD